MYVCSKEASKTHLVKSKNIDCITTDSELVCELRMKKVWKDRQMDKWTNGQPSAYRN